MTVIDAPRPDTASVDAVDPDADDDVDRDVDLDVLIADVTGHLNVQHARLVRLTARALATGAWAGVHTPTRWLAIRAGLSPERAKLVVGIAERADDFPHLMSAFDHGRFTLEQVAEIIKAPAWADDHVLDFAQVATVTQLRRTMRDRFFDDGDDTQPETQPTPPRDRLSFGPTGDLRWRITGELDLDTGRRVEAALTDAKDALFHDGDDTVTWADALVEIAERSLDTVPSPARRDRYRTWLHLDVTNGTATTTDGWRIPMNVRDRILCDGVVQPVWEHDGIPFSVGRTQRVVPDRLRRIIEHRDRGCRVPGCTNDRWVEIHHITHWTNGGPTDTTNLISLCPKHHRDHHRGDLHITGNPDLPGDVAFTDRANRPIGPPTLDPPVTEPTPPRRRYEPPLGQRMDYHYFTGWVSPDELHRRRTAARTRPSNRID